MEEGQDLNPGSGLQNHWLSWQPSSGLKVALTGQCPFLFPGALPSQFFSDKFPGDPLATRSAGCWVRVPWHPHNPALPFLVHCCAPFLACGL